MGQSAVTLKDTNPKLYAVQEALKEVGRYLVSIGVIDSAIVLFQLIQGMINTQTGEINMNWQMILAFTLFSFSGAVIRGLDKLKQVYEKTVNPEPGVSQGIIPF
jgi:hypothetical protein